jgi:hypothetical protein
MKKMVGDRAHVVETCLASKCEALSSNSNSANTKQNKIKQNKTDDFLAKIIRT